MGALNRQNGHFKTLDAIIKFQKQNIGLDQSKPLLHLDCFFSYLNISKIKKFRQGIDLVKYAMLYLRLVCGGLH
jgi:hypothetical protein